MGKFLDVSAESASPQGLYIGDSGTKLFIIYRGGDKVHRYTLSTAWDVNTGTFDSGQTLSLNVGVSAYDLWFNTAGTKLYFMDNGNDRVEQWTLSSAWDLTSASLDGTFDVNPEEAGPYTVALSPDGTKLYISGAVSNTVYQYTVTTAHDITGTVTYASKSMAYGSQLGNARGLYVEDGTNDYVLIGSFTEVDRYSLSTPFDIGSGSFDTGQDFTYTEGGGGGGGLFFKGDGTEMYVPSAVDTDGVYQYTLSTAWDVTTADYEPWTTTDSVTFDTSAPISGNLRAIVWSDDGLHFYCLDQDGDIFQFSCLYAWDIRDASYDTVSKSPTELGAASYGMHIGDSGTKLYVHDSSNDRVRRYTMSTAWDLSSLGGTEDHNYDISANSTAAIGVRFSVDGTKMYLDDSTNIDQYTLTTAWDLSGTVTYNHTTSVSANSGVPEGGVSIKADGLQFFLNDRPNDQIDEYSMSPAWDMSSLAYVGTYSTSSEITTALAIAVQPDGNRMWSSEFSGMIYQYDMDTAWDVTSAFYTPPTTADGDVTVTPTVAATSHIDLHADGDVTLAPTITATAHPSFHADGDSYRV